MVLDRPDDPLNYVQPGAAATAATPATPGWSDQVAQALQELSKSPLAKQPDATPLDPARPTEVPAGRPRQAGSLDALVQLLERRQAQYGTLSGQPVAQPRTLGLLGM